MKRILIALLSVGCCTHLHAAFPEGFTMDHGEQGYFTLSYNSQPIFVNRIIQADGTDSPSPVLVATDPSWMPVHYIGRDNKVKVTTSSGLAGKVTRLVEEAPGISKVETTVTLSDKKATVEIHVKVEPRNKLGANLLNFECELPKEAYWNSTFNDDGIGYNFNTLDDKWLNGKWAEVLENLHQDSTSDPGDDLRYNFDRINFINPKRTLTMTVKGAKNPEDARSWSVTCYKNGRLQLRDLFKFAAETGTDQVVVLTFEISHESAR